MGQDEQDVWTDMRPLSLRKWMAEQAEQAEQADKTAAPC